MRIAIDPIATPIGLPSEYPDDWKTVPDSFLPALVAAKRFIGQTASYRIEGQVAFLHHGKLYATNNQVVLEFDLGPNDLPVAAFAPKDIAVIAAFGPPSGMQADADATVLRWADGSTFLLRHADESDPSRYARRRSNKASDVPSPVEVAAMLGTMWAEPNLDVTDDWRETALATFGQQSIGVLHLKKTHATAEVYDKDGLAATIAVDLGVAVPEASVSCRDFLEVLKFADAIGFSEGSPRRVSFRFSGGRGIIAGQSANERGAFGGSLDLERFMQANTKA